MIDEHPVSDTFERRFEPNPLAASQVRRQARDHLRRRGIDAGLVADVELAVSELLANAVEQQTGEPIHLELTIDPFVIHLTVTNRRAADDVAELPCATDDCGELAERGWGLSIVQALSDGMWVHRDRTSFSVSCLHKRDR